MADVKVLKSFHRRILPCPPAISFSSSEGKSIFREALDAGYMDGYFSLAEQFTTQSEPSFCGLASLSVVLNALEVDPGRVWKGGWRWYAEHMLDCCAPLEKVKEHGITFPQLVCLAKCNGLAADVGNFTGVEEFRNDVKKATKWLGGDYPRHLIVSYSRKSFEQSGDGHFSPIGGYCPSRDLVLILDVARFKYPPHWVPLELLYQSMQSPDPVTGKSRGWVSLTLKSIGNEGEHAKPIYFVLLNSGEGNNWIGLSQFFKKKLSSLSDGLFECGHVPMIQTDNYGSQSSATQSLDFDCLCKNIPSELVVGISTYITEYGLNYIPTEMKAIVEKLKSELYGTEIYHTVYHVLLQSQEEIPSVKACGSVELAAEYTCMLFLVFSENFWSSISNNRSHLLTRLTNLNLYKDTTILHSEIMALRRQFSALSAFSSSENCCQRCGDCEEK